MAAEPVWGSHGALNAHSDAPALAKVNRLLSLIADPSGMLWQLPVLSGRWKPWHPKIEFAKATCAVPYVNPVSAPGAMPENVKRAALYRRTIAFSNALQGNGQFLGRHDIEVHDDGSITFSLEPTDDGVKTLADDIMQRLQDS